MLQQRREDDRGRSNTGTFGVSTDPFFAHIRLTQAESSHRLPCGRLPDEDMSTKIGRCTDRFGDGLSLSLVGLGLLKVPIAGSPTLFLAGEALYGLTVAARGILLDTIAGTMVQCTLLATPVLVIQLLYAGAPPMESMPIALQHVMPPFPAVSLVVALLLTQVVAVLIGGLGWLAPSISWVLIRWVWSYNIAWVFVLGGIRPVTERFAAHRTARQFSSANQPSRLHAAS